VRFKAAEDVEMPEPVIKESLPKPLPKDAPFLDDATKELDDLGPSKTMGRKSGLSETVDAVVWKFLFPSRVQEVTLFV
jgi:hypothetical protein